MASIIILSLAILPMVGMFDMGLQSATRGSNYDKSRALANLKLEEAKSISFADLESDFPEPGSTPPYDEPLVWFTEDGFTNFEYRVKKEYMEQPPTDSDLDPALPSQDWIEDTSGTPTGLIRVTVIVRWADDNEYRTFGLVSA